MSDYLSIQIGAAMRREETLSPGLFSADTPETRRAEAELNAAWVRWREDPQATLADVGHAFWRWLLALKGEGQLSMFGVERCIKHMS